jgi:WD40 repeat protein
MNYPTVFRFLSLAALLWAAGRTAADEKPLKEVRRFSGHKSDVNCLAFSPDGCYLATGSGSDSNRRSENTVRVWEVETAKEVCKLEGHTGAVFSVAFSPDGTQIASGSTDKTISLWDLQKKKEIRRFDGHTSAVVSLAFSPDGKRILSSGYDRSIRVWDVQTGKELRSFDFSKRGYSYYIGPVLFSQSGETALYYPNGTAEISKQVVVFDMKKGVILHTMRGHRDVVRCIAFTPDGRFAFSTGYDIAFKFWDAKKGAEIRSFPAPSWTVTLFTRQAAPVSAGTCPWLCASDRSAPPHCAVAPG